MFVSSMAHEFGGCSGDVAIVDMDGHVEGGVGSIADA